MSTLGSPVFRELSPQGARFRLSPRSGDSAENELVDAATRGRNSAISRCHNRFGGFQLEALAQNIDAKSPQIIPVDSGLLQLLDANNSIDTVLSTMDARDHHCTFAGGHLTAAKGEDEDLINVGSGSAGLCELRNFAGYQALVDGFTIVLNNVVPRVEGELRALVDDLSRVLGCPAQVNVYISEREARGFGRHWDDHDVIVLQCSGRKHWRLFEPIALSPRIGYSPIKEFGEQVFSTVLEPGQALYIPRGWGHEVSGIAGEVSLHYTIGMRYQTMIDVYEECRTLRGENELNALVTEDGSFPQLGLDSGEFEHAVGAFRSRFTSIQGLGPLLIAAAAKNRFENVSFSGAFPGGLVFVDSPELRADEIGFASGQYRYAVHRDESVGLGHLLEGLEVRVGSQPGAHSGEFGSEELLLGLARRGVVSLRNLDPS